MRYPIVFTVVLVSFFGFGGANAQEGRVTVKVSDESGQVISNAIVSASFATNIKPGWGWGSGKPNMVKGYTDTNGICVITGKGNGGEVSIAVLKDGYYGSGGFCVRFTNVSGGVSQKWQPWNATQKVVLRKKGKQIPMYAKQVNSERIPVIGETVGFDLICGDWVVPNGHGKVSDFLFTLSKTSEQLVNTRYGAQKLFDFTLTMRFSNNGDGIVALPIVKGRGGSAFLMDRSAPINGYEKILVKRICQAANKPLHSDVQEGGNYFFRVRTEKDDRGNIVSALYGKIKGDFSDFDYGKITFTYYLNPTPNDRNMEFNPAMNLFKNLSSLEEVRTP
jgi:hypothetical protein